MYYTRSQGQFNWPLPCVVHDLYKWPKVINVDCLFSLIDLNLCETKWSRNLVSLGIACITWHHLASDGFTEAIVYWLSRIDYLCETKWSWIFGFTWHRLASLSIRWFHWSYMKPYMKPFWCQMMPKRFHGCQVKPKMSIWSRFNSPSVCIWSHANSYVIDQRFSDGLTFLFKKCFNIFLFSHVGILHYFSKIGKIHPNLVYL